MPQVAKLIVTIAQAAMVKYSITKVQSQTGTLAQVEKSVLSIKTSCNVDNH